MEKNTLQYYNFLLIIFITSIMIVKNDIITCCTYKIMGTLHKSQSRFEILI